ncbi:ribonuclease H-like protein [Coniophora puteana RWD-64-598 SS2]|uniref:Ribonuclease H-like protein n=1 Tax=Coniophora puteana (strain RWD-64-598) TaxID=741705 RepID=A0A5M3MKZ4_CONPW|nr:ribonuclease H-like protein [Coniophora puteana RWD-64-598 SS2]EIW79838.1 ribonuclease H-like protein [Coniophora puteana RWD-64-598 SS2]
MGTLPSSAVTSSIASSFSATAPSSSTSHPQLSVPPPAIKRKTSASDSLPGQRRRVDEPVDATISTVPKQPSSAETTTPAPLVDEDLPVYSFTDYKDPDPAVVYIRDEKEADRLVQTLEGPLGFDMEWRVFWNPYSQGRTALVQLCDKRTILLIQEVIENPSIVKTGANIMNDGEKLFRDFGIRAHGLVELGMFAKVADDEFMKTYSRRIVALAKMVAMYLRKTLAKGAERTSNWELVLDSKKIEYAANDVHSGCLVYHRLLDIAAEANKEIDMSAVKLDVRSSAEARFVPANTTSTSTASSVAVDSAASQVSTTSASRTAKGSYNTPLPGDPPRPQWMRAYNMWHHRDVPLSEMCSSLMCGGRVEPLKSGTVIGYIVKALQADPSLPYDIGRLTELVKMDADSWKRCGPWILTQEAR